MKKSILFVGCFILLVGNAQAREGAYIGANLAWSQIDTNSRGGALVERVDKKDDGFGGSLYAGYGRMGANGFLALEVNAAMSDTKVDITLGHDKSTLEMKDSFGAGFLMGANLPHNFAAYARIGWQNSKFKNSNSAEDAQWSRFSTHDGLRYGVGVMAGLSELIDLRFELHRTDYNRKTYSDFGTSIKPSENALAIGATLRF